MAVPSVRQTRAVLLISFAGTSALNYLFGLLMGWLLAPGDFGLLAFTQTLLLIAGIVLNAGFAAALVVALVTAPLDQRPALVRGALVCNLLLALGLGLLLLLLFALGPLRAGFELPSLALTLALTLPLLACLGIVRATAQGLERFGLLALLQLAETGVRVAAGLALVRAGLGPGGAALGFLLGALTAAGLGAWLLQRHLGVGLFGPLRWPAARAAGELFGALLGFALLLNLDLIALKLLEGADRALIGQYQAAVVLANTPYYLVAALLPVLFAQVARGGSAAASAAPVGRALRLILLLVVPVELALAGAPEIALGLLFPPGYAAGAPALRLLALGNCAVVVVAVLSTALQALGRAHVPARVFGGALLLEVLALQWAVPRWDGWGAAGVFLAAAALVAGLLGGCYLAVLGRRPLRPALGWLARYGATLLAGTAGYALLRTCGLEGPLALGGGVLGYAGGLARRLAEESAERHMLFVGNYGNRNLGDDTILQILSARYAERFPDHRQHVAIRHAGVDLSRICQARPLTPGPAAAWWVLRHVRLVVIGGGGLFGAHMGPVARFIPLFALLCRALGKTVIYESVGIYRNTPPLQRALLFASMLTARSVSVRDATSWRMTAPLRRLRRVLLVNDPALEIAPAAPEAALACLAEAGLRLPVRSAGLVGLSVKRIIRDPARSAELRAALVQMCAWLLARGYTLLFVPFCDDPHKPWEQDVAFAQEIAAELGPHAAVLCLPHLPAPDQAAAIMRLTRLFVGMRFHALVFAHALGLPLLPIAYEDKRTDFILRHGYPLLPVEQLSGALLIDHLARLLGEPIA